MKNTKIIASLVALVAASTAYAQDVLVAGWEFDESLRFNDDTVSSLSFAADKTQITGLTDGSAPTIGSATVSYDANLFFGDVDVINSSLSSNLGGAATTRNPLDSFDGGLGTFVANDITNFGVNALDLVFSVDTAGAEFFENWGLSLSSTGGSYSLGVSYSTDGVNFTSAGNLDVTGADTLSTFSFANAGVSDEFYVAFDLAGLNGTGARLDLDNVALTGTATVVPEPSTYAAIAGALALGFVAYRRRK